MLLDISTSRLKTLLFHRAGLNLPSQSGLFCTRVSFHFISWFLWHDRCPHACCREPKGTCSWTPPAVWVCYLNPWSRIAFLPFSRALIAHPDWHCSHTVANSTVQFENPLEFSHLAPFSFFFIQSSCPHVIVCVRLYVNVNLAFVHI